MSVLNAKNLLITDGRNENTYLSGRNIKWLEIKPAKELNAYDIISNDNIIFGSEQLIGKMEEVTAK
jgi:ribosomal protein L4